MMFFSFKTRNAFGRSFLFLAVVISCASCATVTGPLQQANINSLVVSNRLDMAADKISTEGADYGSGNYLLYHLDRGMIEFLAGRHEASVRSFEKAKLKFDELYTKALTREAGSWLLNDNTLAYRGSDYEYILVNVLQALNFVQMGNILEALVEGRDMASKFAAVETVARDSKRRFSGDNGFARLFMGILFEASGAAQDREDARLFYKEAAAFYDGYYAGKYRPRLLAEKLEEFGTDSVRQAGKAQVYLIEFVGFSPVKVPDTVSVPVDRELITKIALPRFMNRIYDTRRADLSAERPDGSRITVETELGVDIEDMAARDLEARKAIVLTKSVVRPALKLLVEQKQKENVEKEYGRGAAEVFGVFANLYNLYSEQADLRSWQALPAQIRVARLWLDPGPYHFRARHLSEEGAALAVDDLGAVDLKAGETRFFIRRAAF